MVIFPLVYFQNTWLEKLSEAREKFGNESCSRQNSFKENKNPNSEDGNKSPSPGSTQKRQRKINVLQTAHTKSYSVDSVYI